MKLFSEQIKKKAERIKMRATERRELRERVVSYMEYHPLSEAVLNKQANKKIKAYFKFNLTTYVRASTAIFILFIVVGIPIIAERALPGDVLYPIKVQFTEELRSKLAFSPYAKVEWETERLERRISEARLLASEGKLTEEVEAEVALAVQAHSEAVQQEIAVLRENDADEAAIAEIAFESALEVQSAVLDADASDTKGMSTVAIAGVVDDALVIAGAIQTVTPSFEKLIARMEIETTRAYEFFSSVGNVASETEVADVERRLTDIELKMTEAIALNGNETEEAVGRAVAILTEALSDTRKLISFMTDIDVRATVTIEELVPVTLTLEERITAVNSQLSEIENGLVVLDGILETSEDIGVLEKIALGYDIAVEKASTTHIQLTSGDIDGAEISVSEADSIVKNLLSSIENTATLEGEEVVESEVLGETIESDVTNIEEIVE